MEYVTPVHRPKLVQAVPPHAARQAVQLPARMDWFHGHPAPVREATQRAVSVRPSQIPVLQRACACGGGTTGISGKCEECSKSKRLGMQAKLGIGDASDVYEQEADQIADQVITTRVDAPLSGVQPRIDRISGPSNGQMEAAPASVDRAVASSGRPLAAALRRDMEQRFGYDFSRVRVHSDAAAARSAQDVKAHAYTVGHNVVFGAGRFTPETQDGRRLIAHELTHVIQQSAAQGVGVDQINEKRSRFPSSQAALRRKPDKGSPTDAADPINEDNFPGYAWHEILSIDSNIKPGVNYVRVVVRENTEVDRELLDAATVTWFYRKNVSSTNRPSSYYAFRHPTRGVIARAFAELDERIYPGQEAAPERSFRYKFYVFSAHSSGDRGHYATPMPLSSAPPFKEDEMEEVTHWIRPDGRPNFAGKRCRFFIYDSEEPTFARLWAFAARYHTTFSSNAFRIPSGKSIVTMLKAVLDTYSAEDCGCVSEIQFWSHGNPYSGMPITGDGEFTTESFNIPGVEIFGMGPLEGESGYQDWYRHLSDQQRLLVVLRRTICDPYSEVYYRSCQTFQGESGQKFADASGKFWRSIVIGHTKLIGLSQPGQKRLKFGQKPYWPETEGKEEEGKKGKTGEDFRRWKPR